MKYARVVVDVAPAHLDRLFDYLVPEGMAVRVGSRVRVVFNGRPRVGWVAEVAGTPSADVDRVRPLERVDGELSWFDDDELPLLRWVADRYAGTVADVLRHALPQRVVGVEQEARRWDPPAPREGDARPPCALTDWRPYDASELLKATFDPRQGAPAFWLRVLPGDDPATLVADLVGRCLAGGRDALVLAPDPVSPLPNAALDVAGAAGGADLRSERPRDRARAFWRCRSGHARVAVGERSAVFAPLRNLGLVVVDDEANPAYKERRSPRHHAREVALARARRAGAVTVLLGDLPSANLWRLLQDGHVRKVAADRATERERAPRVDVADLSDPRPGTRRTRFTDAAARLLSEVVKDSGAAVVLASRGGQGTGIACRQCRLRRTCPECAGSLSGALTDVWTCATCGWEGRAFPCSACGAIAHAPLAAGAGRFAAELARSYPAADVGRMEGFDAPGPTRRPAIAVMTRGSVVARPAWLSTDDADVIVLPDADAMLGRPALDAAEDALRLWFAAGHWGGRMVVQTREPLSHAVQALVRWDPEGFWEREAVWRADLRYPPAGSLIDLRVPPAAADEVAAQLREALPADDAVLGPDPDGALLVKCGDRRKTLAALIPLRHAWSREGRRVRVDVDPVL